MTLLPPIVSLDIETTGLDPAESALVAVGLADGRDSAVQAGGDERTLLAWLEERVGSAPVGTVLTTWNGEEFDLPFLRERLRRNRVPTTLALQPRGKLGKYGKPLYAATWSTLNHVDIAPRYKRLAHELGVPWQLKPVARALLGIDPVEVDNRGEAIAALNERELRRYLRSDIEITLALSKRLAAAGELTRPQTTADR